MPSHAQFRSLPGERSLASCREGDLLRYDRRDIHLRKIETVDEKLRPTVTLRDVAEPQLPVR